VKKHLLLISLLLTAGISQAETVTLELLNGDSVTGTIVEELSNNQEKVLDHPQLGRLTILTSSLKSKQTAPAWRTSMTAGLIGNEKDGDSSLSTTISVESKYKKGRNNLLLKAGLNTSQSRDNGEPLEIETQKGMAEVRYDYNMPSGLGLFTLIDYNYDGKNDSGVNSLLTGIGLAKPVIQNETTELVVALGPSMQWTNGGHECGKDSYCGNAYAGATFTTDLSWQPSKMFKLELNNKFSSAFTPDIKPANNFKAKFKFYPSIYSGLFTSLQYHLIYQSMSTPEVNNSASLQLGADF
jgi:hypothetical protein